MEIVAEFTTNHMGNLNVLLEMVRKAAWAGATIIKMQKKNVDTFYSKEKLAGAYNSPHGKTYHDYRKIFEFDLESFQIFDRECKVNNIPWYATVQDSSSAFFFADNFPEMPMVKIASCNTGNEKLMRDVKEMYDVPVVVSIGGTEIGQVDKIVEYFNDREVIIQQCTSTYPCPYDQLYLGNIPALKERYKNDNVKVGYSGHERGYTPSVIAASLGAETIERHFCLSRHSFVHHIECSLEPEEFKMMTHAICKIPSMLATNFGLKDSEKRFLIDGAYSGTDFIKDKSEL